MKPTTLKRRHTTSVDVQATVDIDTGRPLVEIREDNAFADPQYLTPREARSMARALWKHANAADRKRDAVTRLRAQRVGRERVARDFPPDEHPARYGAS